MRKFVDYIIICVILCGSAFYLSRNLCGVQVHDDEGIYLYSAWRVSEGELPYRDFFDPQAPLSHLLLGYVFRLTGPSLFVARFASVLAMSLTAVLVYLIGKAVLSRACGVSAGALFIFHPLIFSQGRLFMPESFMLLFYCAGVYLVLKGIRTGRLFFWFLAGLSFGLSTAAKVFGILSVVGLIMLFAVLLMWKRAETKTNLKRIVLSGTGFAVAILFTFALLSFSTSGLYYSLFGHHAEKGVPPWQDTVGVFEMFFREPQNSFLGILSIIGLMWFLIGREPGRLYLSLNLILPAFFLLTRTVFAERHLVFAVPFLCLMAPCLMAAVWRRKPVAIALTVVLVIISFPVYFSPSLLENRCLSRAEAGSESVVEYVVNETQPGAYVFCDYPSINFLAQRKLPPRLVDVGSTSTKTGVLDCNEIVYELQKCRPAMLLIRSGPPHHISALKKYRRKLNYDRFMTYVGTTYDFNRFLEGGDMTFAVYDRKHVESCGILPPFEAEFLDGETGINVVDWEASLQMAKHWHPGLGSGDVVYDSCLKFLPGKYVSGFRLKVVDIAGYEEIGVAEILSKDNILIAKKILTAGNFRGPGVYQYFPLEFTLKEREELLVRFRVNGKRAFWLDTVVFSLPDVEMDESRLERDFYGTVANVHRRLYECEEMPHTTGSKRDDKSALGGRCLRYSYGDDAPGTLVFGPYERYPAGKYRVVYRLKADGSLNDEAILKLDVVSHSPDGGTNVLAERELETSDFLRDGYQDFSLNFASDGYRDRLEFRIEVWGKTDIEADTIEVCLRY